MDLVTEIENEFSARSESPAPGGLLVKTALTRSHLRLQQLGLDYVAGLNGGVLVIFPTRNIQEIQGASLPQLREQSLNQLLGSQKAPVRINLRTGELVRQCWLLNIQDGWLRVAISKGLSWVPLQAVESIEILAVDNSNQ